MRARTGQGSLAAYMKDARRQLQDRLDAINKGEDRPGKTVLGGLSKEGATFGVRVGFVRFKRAGARLIVSADAAEFAKDEVAQRAVRGMFELLSLLLEVGMDRIRQCPLAGCGNWFAARKGQRWCSLEHSNRGAYEKWRAKQTKGRRKR